ncbi:cell wall-binding repeat-containing protein [Phycicoccus flavus]|uniref:Cell wall-binding repeat-containing protein n=1 Tax=Phycicoccus flavus TaxID=2502783 RepID=A0A8T6R6C5_9MICO|nr:cell wall-binding repeat-containing protein [Phycicoccus flavus]NHA69517.1 cell wall-binding repeat-containing protein [Phycicoccus flavus]
MFARHRGPRLPAGIARHVAAASPAGALSARSRLLAAVVALATTAFVALVVGAAPTAQARTGPVDVVYVASGRVFPDALAGGVLAANRNAPVLLVEPTSIPTVTKSALISLQPGRIVVLGGPGSVSDEVVGALATFTTSGSATRIAGGNRFDTAARVAEALPDTVPGRVYWLHVSGSGTVRTSLSSPELAGTTVTRAPGQAAGGYCVDVPDGKFAVEGTMATLQSSYGSGISGPDSIRVVTTFNHICVINGLGEIEVRLSSDAGTLEDGYFGLLVPGK